MDFWSKIKGITGSFYSSSKNDPVEKKPWPSPTWAEVRENVDHNEEQIEDGNNGYKLNGVLIPEVALEILLSWVPVENILTLSKVCRTWKDVTTRKSFWKLVFQKNGIVWDSITEHVKEKGTGWMVLYAAARHRIFQENLITNPCGEDGFAHWKKVRNRGDGLIVESPPVGIPGLPDDSEFPVDSAFVTSCDWCSIVQKIDLRGISLTPAVLATMTPFQFNCSEMVGVRFDCGGRYRLTVTLEDEKGSAVFMAVRRSKLPAGEGWTNVTASVVVTEEDVEKLRTKNVRYLVIRNDGTDDFWLDGHYGTKFSRISVQLKCISPSSSETDASRKQENVTVGKSPPVTRPENEDGFSELDEINSEFSSDTGTSDYETTSSDSDSYKEIVTDSEVEDEDEADEDDDEESASDGQGDMDLEESSSSG